MNEEETEMKQDKQSGIEVNPGYLLIFLISISKIFGWNTKVSCTQYNNIIFPKH